MSSRVSSLSPSLRVWSAALGAIMAVGLTLSQPTPAHAIVQAVLDWWYEEDVPNGSQQFEWLMQDAAEKISDMRDGRAFNDPCAKVMWDAVRRAAPIRGNRLRDAEDWTDDDETTIYEATGPSNCEKTILHATWKKSMSRPSGGVIFLTAQAVNCDCEKRSRGARLEAGSVSMQFDVYQVRGVDSDSEDDRAFRLGPPRNIRVMAPCCGNTDRDQWETIHVTSTGEIGDRISVAGQQQAEEQKAEGNRRRRESERERRERERQQEEAQRERERERAEAKRQQELRAQEAEARRQAKIKCEACRQHADDLLAAQAKHDALLLQRQQILNDLSANAEDQRKVDRAIRLQESRLRGQRGVGAESTDPYSGITTRAYDNGQGQVMIQEFQGGRPLGPPREADWKRQTTEEIKAKIEELKGKKQALETARKKFGQDLQQNQRDRTAQKREIARLAALLQECIRRWCTPGTTPSYITPGIQQELDKVEEGQEQASGGSGAEAAEGGAGGISSPNPCDRTKDVELGPAKSFAESAGAKAAGMAKGAAQGMLGKALGGGGIGFGGGGGGAKKSGPPTDDMPMSARDLQRFKHPTAPVTIAMGGIYDPARGYVFVQKIIKAPGDGVIHDFALQQGCGYHIIRGSIHEVYSWYFAGGISVSINYDYKRYEDGQLVEHRNWTENPYSNEWMSYGMEERVEYFQSTTTWGSLGVPTPYRGPESVGTVIQGPVEMVNDGTQALVSVTWRGRDKIYRASTFLFDVTRNDDDTVSFAQAKNPCDNGVQIDQHALYAGGGYSSAYTGNVQAVEGGGFSLSAADYLNAVDVNLTNLFEAQYESKAKGGMTQVDPPKLQLDPGDNAIGESVIGDLGGNPYTGWPTVNTPPQSGGTTSTPDLTTVVNPNSTGTLYLGTNDKGELICDFDSRNPTPAASTGGTSSTTGTADSGTALDATGIMDQSWRLDSSGWGIGTLNYGSGQETSEQQQQKCEQDSQAQQFYADPNFSFGGYTAGGFTIKPYLGAFIDYEDSFLDSGVATDPNIAPPTISTVDEEGQTQTFQGTVYDWYGETNLADVFIPEGEGWEPVEGLFGGTVYRRPLPEGGYEVVTGPGSGTMYQDKDGNYIPQMYTPPSTATNGAGTSTLDGGRQDILRYDTPSLGPATIAGQTHDQRWNLSGPTYSPVGQWVQNRHGNWVKNLRDGSQVIHYTEEGTRVVYDKDGEIVTKGPAVYADPSDGPPIGQSGIRYTSPTIAGFTLSTNWSEDDYWATALRYAGEFGGLRVAGGVGYEPSSTNTSQFDDIIYRKNIGRIGPIGGETPIIGLGVEGTNDSTRNILGINHVPTGIFVQGAYDLGNSEGQVADESPAIDWTTGVRVNFTWPGTDIRAEYKYTPGDGAPVDAKTAIFTTNNGNTIVGATQTNVQGTKIRPQVTVNNEPVVGAVLQNAGTNAEVPENILALIPYVNITDADVDRFLQMMQTTDGSVVTVDTKVTNGTSASADQASAVDGSRWYDFKGGRRFDFEDGRYIVRYPDEREVTYTKDGKVSNTLSWTRDVDESRWGSYPAGEGWSPHRGHGGYIRPRADGGHDLMSRDGVLTHQNRDGKQTYEDGTLYVPRTTGLTQEEQRYGPRPEGEGWTPFTHDNGMTGYRRPRAAGGHDYLWKNGGRTSTDATGRLTRTWRQRTPAHAHADEFGGIRVSNVRSNTNATGSQTTGGLSGSSGREGWTKFGNGWRKTFANGNYVYEDGNGTRLLYDKDGKILQAPESMWSPAPAGSESPAGQKNTGSTAVGTSGPTTRWVKVGTGWREIFEDGTLVERDHDGLLLEDDDSLGVNGTPQWIGHGEGGRKKTFSDGSYIVENKYGQRGVFDVKGTEIEWSDTTHGASREAWGNQNQPSGSANGNHSSRVENLFDSALGPVTTTTPGMRFQYTYLDDTQLEVILRAVEKSSNVQALSTPSLMVMNTQRANVSVVNQISYVQDFDVEVAQSASIQDPVVQTVQDGVILDVRPVVSADRRFITLELRPTVAELVRPIPQFTTSLAGSSQPVEFQLPELETGNIRTTLAIANGGTVIVGGIQTNVETGEVVPPIDLFGLPFVAVLLQNTNLQADEIRDLIVALPQLQFAGGGRGGVTIETRFLDVEDRFLRDVGVDFRGLGSTNGQPVGFGLDTNEVDTVLSESSQVLGNLLSLNDFLNSEQFEAQLRRYEQEGTEIAQAPKLVTLDKEEATIFVGETIRYAGSSSLAQVGQNVEVVDNGVVLQVSPHITETGKVQLTLNPQPGSGIEGGTFTELPRIDTKRVETQVLVRDGQTVVLGGIMQDQSATTENKIPLLGDMPALGYLFRREATKNTKTELMIFVTAGIVTPPEE